MASAFRKASTSAWPDWSIHGMHGSVVVVTALTARTDRIGCGTSTIATAV